MSSVSLVPRLIGVSSKSMGQVGSVVDVIVLGLTILGALAIMGGLAYREFQTGASTVRTRLLLFLVFADLYMGVFGIIAPTYYLTTGHGPPAKVCSMTAFMLLGSFWAQYLNAISLAVSTYLILLHPLSTATRLLQRFWIWLFPLIWGISFIASGVAWRVSGFTFAGGFCYIGSGGPEFFSDIYAFVPRSIVLIIVVTLYSRLFVFLRRPDRLGSPQSSQVDEIRTTPSTGASARWWGRKSVLGTGIAGESVGTPPLPPPTTRRETLQNIRALDEKEAPWEALDLQIPDFAASSDPSSNIRHVTLAEPRSPHSESPLGGSRRNSAYLSPPLPVILTTTPTAPNSPEASSYFASLPAIPPPTSPASLDPSISSTFYRPETRSLPSFSNTLSPNSPKRFKLPSDDSTLSEGDSSSESDADSLSPPSRKPGGRRSRGMSLKDILEAEGPAGPMSSSMEARGTGSWGGEEARGSGSGDTWQGQESMNAYLNRKASMLMILFPLAYVALFSVSLVRIICDFAVHNPIPILSFAGRILIFSQGIVDFAIYGVVEWKVKRDVRRKTSQGHFAPNSNRSGSYNAQAQAAANVNPGSSQMA